MRPEFESNQSLEIFFGDDSHELTFTFTLECTAPSSPGNSDPWSVPEPPSRPEFGLTTIQVAVSEVNFQRPPLSWRQFEGMVGGTIAGLMLTAAEDEAIESGEF